jgi:predicted RNA polymerase sigma factor
MTSLACDMKTNQSSPGANTKTADAQKPAAEGALYQILTAFEPSPEAVARRAYAIYEDQGSQPGNEVRHWLEAKAQLSAGVERESQMHPGDPLFKAEH